MAKLSHAPWWHNEQHDGRRSRRTRNQAPFKSLLAPCHRPAARRPRDRDRQPRGRPENHRQSLGGGLVAHAWAVHTLDRSDALGRGRRVFRRPTEKNAAGRECSRGGGRWQRGRRRLRRWRVYHATAKGLLTITTCVHTATTCMYPAAGIAMAEAVETMVGQPAPSVIADEVICPALREYGARVRCPRQTDRRPIPRQVLTAACRLLTPPVAIACAQARAWTTRSARR